MTREIQTRHCERSEAIQRHGKNHGKNHGKHSGWLRRRELHAMTDKKSRAFLAPGLEVRVLGEKTQLLVIDRRQQCQRHKAEEYAGSPRQIKRRTDDNDRHQIAGQPSLGQDRCTEPQHEQ